jgi:hypothetical protein
MYDELGCHIASGLRSNSVLHDLSFRTREGTENERKSLLYPNGQDFSLRFEMTPAHLQIVND